MQTYTSFGYIFQMEPQLSYQKTNIFVMVGCEYADIISVNLESSLCFRSKYNYCIKSTLYFANPIMQ